MSLRFNVTCPDTLDILLESWAPSSRAQYESALNKWFHHCNQFQVDPFRASHEQGVKFIVQLFKATTLGYSAMGTIRSALSSVLPLENGTKFGKNPMVSRLLKGIFRQRPALPKSTVLWDVDIVFHHFMECNSRAENSLKFHVMKLAVLLCILSGQRTQTLGKLDLGYMQLENSRVIFFNSQILKTTRPGFHVEPLTLLAYPHNQVLCPVTLFSCHMLAHTNLYQAAQLPGMWWRC